MTTTIMVRCERGEYGEFFVNERETVKQDGYIRYSATWTCYSSFGVFGHHWYDMGCPFDEFISDISPDYLLSKIARRVNNEDKMAAGLRTLIDEASVSQETKQCAIDALESFEDEGYGPEVLAYLIYQDDDIHECGIDFCDIDSMEYDSQAVCFVKTLWPLFVVEIAKK